MPSGRPYRGSGVPPILPHDRRPDGGKAGRRPHRGKSGRRRAASATRQTALRHYRPLRRAQGRGRNRTSELLLGLLISGNAFHDNRGSEFTFIAPPAGDPPTQLSHSVIAYNTFGRTAPAGCSLARATTRTSSTATPAPRTAENGITLNGPTGTVVAANTMTGNAVFDAVDTSYPQKQPVDQQRLRHRQARRTLRRRPRLRSHSAGHSRWVTLSVARPEPRGTRFVR